MGRTDFSDQFRKIILCIIVLLAVMFVVVGRQADGKIVSGDLTLITLTLLPSFLSKKEMGCKSKKYAEAIRTQTQSSKPNREITKIINSQNTKRTYD